MSWGTLVGTRYWICRIVPLYVAAANPCVVLVARIIGTLAIRKRDRPFAIRSVAYVHDELGILEANIHCVDRIRSFLLVKAAKKSNAARWDCETKYDIRSNGSVAIKTCTRKTLT
jgi:hypothetical protein